MISEAALMANVHINRNLIKTLKVRCQVVRKLNK